MLHIATSNEFMDWQKYPKRKKSIRIRQPETLHCIKCPTFPGMRGSTLDILLHDFQFFFAKVLIEMPAHTNSFIVLCDGVKSDFMACARQSDSELVLLSQLDAGPSRRPGRTASAAVGWPGAAPLAAWALMRSVLMHWKRHGQAGGRCGCSARRASPASR